MVTASDRSRLRRIVVWAVGTLLVIAFAIGYQAIVPTGEQKGAGDSSLVHDDSPGTNKPGESK